MKEKKMKPSLHFTVKNSITYWLCFFSMLQYAENNIQPEVRTKLGIIIGKREDYHGCGVDAFLGVPYTEPPVGELRFKMPKPIEKYKFIIKADKHPIACMQNTPEVLEDVGVSEDCLYLNIWKRSSRKVTSKQKASVIYWIHGGTFLTKYIGDPQYNGKALAAFGDVIVVTVAYRLGAMGFLYLGTKDIPGNMGLYDILLGLKWVRKNIAAFGGDKNKITIAGESAGAMTVGYLAVSPLSRGLYLRCIMLSGTPAYLVGEDNDRNLKFSQMLAKSVNCADGNATNISECMRKIDAFSLTNSLMKLPTLTLRYFVPQFGDAILPKNARISLINGQFHNTDLLVGNVKDEGSFQLIKEHTDIFGEYGENCLNLNKTYGEMRIRNFFSTFSNIEDIVQYYLGDVHEYDFETVRRRVYTSFGDSTFLCPSVYTAEKFQENGNKVFYYFFKHRPSVSPFEIWIGVRHNDDVPFVFGLPTYERTRYTPAEMTLSKRMMELYTNYTKFGIPSRDWFQYSREDPRLLVLDTNEKNPIFIAGPHKKNCDFFRRYFGYL